MIQLIVQLARAELAASSFPPCTLDVKSGESHLGGERLVGIDRLKVARESILRVKFAACQDVRSSGTVNWRIGNVIIGQLEAPRVGHIVDEETAAAREAERHEAEDARRIVGQAIPGERRRARQGRSAFGRRRWAASERRARRRGGKAR